MTAIKHALQRDIFTPNDERLLSIVNVCKAGKKNCFLLWLLQDLAVVDAKDAVKNIFISCLWKLNQRYLLEKIYFANVSSQLLEESVPSGENQTVTGGDEEAAAEYQELNAREKQDIEIMMEDCEYAISNAEVFAEKLSRELQVLDGANIQSIMASEKQVNILMQLLDEALKEVDHIEGKLSSYEEMLQSVKEQMDQISESNHLIELSKTNSDTLLGEIEFLVETAVKQETESLHGSAGKLTGSTSSLNKLSVQSSSSCRSQSSSLLDMGNMSASDLDVADRTTFDKIFEQVLSELQPLCLAEQDFISKFFNLSQHQSISRTPMGETEELDGGASSRTQNTAAQSDLIALGDKIDSFNSMYMLIKMSHHVWTAGNVDSASFLSTALGNVLVTVKRNFDKCTINQIKQMEEVKVSKKSKVGILPFVLGFEEFAELAESIFRVAERRGDLDKAYTKLIKGVFINIEKVANESQKTPRDVVMMENFHRIFATLSRLKISCLEAEKRDAKRKYSDHLQSYVIVSLGHALEKLTGIGYGEVSYQLAFSKQGLQKVIKDYPGKEVKKGLENLYRKVDKHLCKEENLLQVVWHSMQDEFIRQYKHFEGLEIQLQLFCSEVMQTILLFYPWCFSITEKTLHYSCLATSCKFKMQQELQSPCK
ncbi:hypothetical protein XELAEV_18005299mg [Xenopus laevis]|uniref:Exocyst complex component Sec3 PIP2-binding N-terminal domain-containing protein n=1 Tax=Xenopus laevis TaxID=8355 RepID=A0A974DXE0_XENLA|nr:hypothetical protein XELAEV_18005299mg [Xenopus laevis]